MDDLAALADLARREKLRFHVDGAFGALAILAPELAPKLAGIERADSLAFDFHKWGQVPTMPVSFGSRRRAAPESVCCFVLLPADAKPAAWPPVALALRLRSGPFARLPRAEDVVHAEGYGRSHRIGHFADVRAGSLSRTTNRQHAGAGTAGAGGTEYRLLPLPLSACGGWHPTHATTERQIVIELQESGSVAPSTTMVDGRLAIRAAIVNHRTGQGEIDRLLDKTLRVDAAWWKERGKLPPRRPSHDAEAPPRSGGRRSCPTWRTSWRPIRIRSICAFGEHPCWPNSAGWWTPETTYIEVLNASHTIWRR